MTALEDVDRYVNMDVIYWLKRTPEDIEYIESIYVTCARRIGIMSQK
jgi:hypothetical protein